MDDQFRFTVFRRVEETAVVELRSLLVVKGDARSTHRVEMQFCPLGDDGLWDDASMPLPVVIEDARGVAGVASELRTVILDAVATGKTAERWRIAGMQIRMAGRAVLAALGKG